ncbi:ATP-binding protein [Streptomyces beijiangensis]|uniref:ATP-binding protein n=1 Tax=Streptomyces beijiangensis TaxID=163361 RepID=A0A939F497_9ACTN|nr:ATP-binding protein [Streptomyces beijiangensis]MBO0511633.1 ATP-binding protein [Streptomyces beijiangensis]
MVHEQNPSAAGEVGAVVLRWVSAPHCVGWACCELRKALAGWGLSAVEDPATLALSELLTNAVRHARVVPVREIETRILRMERGVRIEVHDSAYQRPKLRPVGAESSGGRGMELVAAVADRWDVAERVGPGKVVWAECLVPAEGGVRDE